MNATKWSFDKKNHEAALPEDWTEAVRHSRFKPSPFQVVEVEQEMIKG